MAGKNVDQSFDFLVCDSIETYSVEIDATRNKRARQYFFRKSLGLILPDLYWYEHFGAMLSANRVYLTPSVSLCGKWVLMAILRTRCNKPWIECVQFSVDDNKVVLFDKDSKWMSQEWDYKKAFDRVAANR